MKTKNCKKCNVEFYTMEVLSDWANNLCNNCHREESFKKYLGV